jgi:hypothetical protein
MDFPDTPFSAGKDDISVAQLSTAEGDVKWLKQIGSFYGNDGVARCGGVVPNAADKAVMFGDTTGQFYRDRSEDSHPHCSDTFVLILDQTDRGDSLFMDGPALSYRDDPLVRMHLCQPETKRARYYLGCAATAPFVVSISHSRIDLAIISPVSLHD